MQEKLGWRLEVGDCVGRGVDGGSTMEGSTKKEGGT
jgi:hypothetical protein